MRWPGLVQPRTEINDIVSAEDWVPTLVAAAGTPDIKDKLLQGYSAGDKSFKVHLEGYDQRVIFAGRTPDQRREFFYWTDDGNLAGLRFDQYKVVFMEQQAHGLEVWMQPLVPLRAPKIFNLRSDPFELGDHEAGAYDKWFIEHAFVFVPAQAIVGQHLSTFQKFPPRQKPGSFSVDQGRMTFDRVIFWSGVWNVGLGLVLVTPPVREFLGLKISQPVLAIHRRSVSLVYGCDAHFELARHSSFCVYR